MIQFIFWNVIISWVQLNMFPYHLIPDNTRGEKVMKYYFLHVGIGFLFAMFLGIFVTLSSAYFVIFCSFVFSIYRVYHMSESMSKKKTF